MARLIEQENDVVRREALAVPGDGKCLQSA